jgi:TPP-dependent pyruvate/acetoin dehydrogenase alpha subunit
MAATTTTRQGKVPPAKAPASTPPTGNPLLSNAKLQQLYASMLACRMLADSTRRTSRRGSEVPSGKEAIVVGTAIGLRREDWLASSQDDILSAFVKGSTLSSLISKPGKHKPVKTSWKEKPKATQASSLSELHLLPGDGDAVAQLHRATGLALAAKANGHGNIVVAFFDETPKFGQHWRESLAFAGEHCLPLLLVMHSTASKKKRASAEGMPFASLLGEGRACAVPVIPVDAEDVVAIYRVAYESIHKARHGGGPTLIQAVAFPKPKAEKRGRHSGPALDSVSRMERYLETKQLFSEVWKKKLVREFQRDLDKAVNVSRPRKRDRA